MLGEKARAQVAHFATAKERLRKAGTRRPTCWQVAKEAGPFIWEGRRVA